MRIGIDNISPGEATGRSGPGGMRHYLQSLIIEFSRLRPAYEFVLFTPAWSDALLEQPLENVRVQKLHGVPVNRLARAIYQQTVLPAVLARERLSVFFATATVAPLLAPLPIVLAIQFLQFYSWPASYGRFRTAYLKLMLPLSVRKARTSIIFTESARADLRQFARAGNRPVEVVPHGLADDLLGLPDLPSASPERAAALAMTNGRPYVLYVSATYGYKNHARLIQAFGLLKRAMDVPHVLMLVGGEDAVSFAELRAVAEQARVTEHVVFAGRIESHAEVRNLYRSADLFVFPSLYETFGFPMLEAMACRCPVVAAANGSVGELGNGSAVLVDATDPAALMAGMAAVLEDPALRARLIASGHARVQTLTVRACATRTLEILERAADA